MRAIPLLALVVLLAPMIALAFPCSEYPPDPCELPPEFAHLTVVEEAGIRVTFASTQDEYTQGDTIEFRLKLENVGTEYFCMIFGYSPIDVVYVLPSGCSNIADPCADDSPWFYPGLVYFVPGPGVGLNPGECRVFSYSWNTAADPAVPGDYVVLSGLFEATFDAAVGEFRMPSTGVSLPIHIGAAVPAGEVSTSVLKARFH